MSKYFPKSMRTSKATFIPGPRTIFSLDNLTKIIEGVLTIQFNECKEEDYEKNGDPGGFAYRKDRGVVSCLGIALSEVERQPKLDLKGVVMVFCDLKKAFNSACRATMVRLAQQVCGAGRIIWSRFCDRTYTFENQVRGGSENRGVDAGTPISVFGFDSFINSDKSTTAANTGLLAHPNYSDDRNITGSGSYIESGKFQRDISCESARNGHGTCQRVGKLGEMGEQLEECAYCWSKTEGVEFHESGAKAPQCMIFKPKINGRRVLAANGSDSLKLGSTPIEVVDRQRVLGLNISTAPTVPGNAELFSSQSAQRQYETQAYKIIDKYGYYLEPNIETYRTCAYRFQNLRDKENPSRLALAVSSYFIGKMRFCAAFYFLRSTKKQLDTIRFYYGMALSAILGLTAYETLGACCCKNMSVSEDNESLKKLLRITGLPSLKSLAIQDARTFVKQVWISNSELFMPEGVRLKAKEIERYEKAKKDNKPFFPKFCAKAYEKTLLWDCWRLVKEANIEGNIDPVSDSKRSKTLPKHKKKKGVKMYQRFWQLANERVQEKKDVNRKARMVRETFRVQVLAELEALEDSDRRYKHRTPTKRLHLDTRCTVYPPEWKKGALRSKPVLNFSCRKPAPQLYMSDVYAKCAKDEQFPCLICGDFIKSGKRVRCVNCSSDDRVAHARCVKQSKLNITHFKCESIVEHLIPIELGGNKAKAGSLEPLQTSPRFNCLICGDPISCIIEDSGQSVESSNLDVQYFKYNRDTERPCRFGCHSQCLEAHAKVSGRAIREADFQCSVVDLQFRPNVVQSILSESSSVIRSKRVSLSKINRIKPSVDKRKRRFSDSESVCSLCQESVPLSQKQHLLHHCRSLKSNPAHVGHVRDYRAFSKRCFEIAEKRLKVDSPHNADVIHHAPTRTPGQEWGSDDGESLSEVAPRRKRNRPHL